MPSRRRAPIRGSPAVPAGDWRLSLWYWRDIADGGGTLRQLQLASLSSLCDGETRWLDLDIAATQPGRVVDPERDIDGWITVDPVPPQLIQVLAYPVGFDAAARLATDPETRKTLVIRLGPVTVPADQQESRVELRIPAGK